MELLQIAVPVLACAVAGGVVCVAGIAWLAQERERQNW